MRSEPQPIVYDPLANMSEDEQEEFNSYFSNDNEDKPRISTINLPETTTTENRPQIPQNPLIRTRWMRRINENSVEIHVEDWL